MKFNGTCLRPPESDEGGGEDGDGSGHIQENTKHPQPTQLHFFTRNFNKLLCNVYCLFFLFLLWTWYHRYVETITAVSSKQ